MAAPMGICAKSDRGVENDEYACKRGTTMLPLVENLTVTLCQRRWSIFRIANVHLMSDLPTMLVYLFAVQGPILHYYYTQTLGVFSFGDQNDEPFCHLRLPIIPADAVLYFNPIYNTTH